MRRTSAISQCIFALGGVLLCAGVQANEVLELEGTSISGHREQPKVLYIVPWQKPEAGGSLNRPVDGVAQMAIQPLERSEFQRQVLFFNAIRNARQLITTSQTEE